MRIRSATLLAAAAVAVAASLLATSAGSATPSATIASEEAFQVLIFSRTTGYRHASIEFGVEAIRGIGEENGFGVTATEDPTQFTEANLAQFEAVIFLNTTGTVLDDPAQKRALRRYMRAGGGFVGIHSAADTEHEWPFYEKLVGALFKSHPLQQMAELENEAPRQPSTSHLEQRFAVFDEWYSFKTNPRPGVRVMLTIDESTYSPDPNTSNLPGGTPATGVMGDHPMAWCHDNAGGRAFYTAIGHEPYLYELDWYRQHLLGGILTATKQVKARCKPPSG